MSVIEKPFACNEKNCTMTFTNEDHLSVHKKKHLMSFDLEFSGKDVAAFLGDQTPTPTSFFRNCEEVGLFQDLQNVNPFEETFKKALESPSNDGTKLGPLSLLSNEDTLHTPHIFPNDEQQTKSITDNNNDLSIVNFVEIPELNDKMEIISDINSNVKSKESQELKTKLKQALLRKEKQKNTPNVVITDNFYIFNTNINNCTNDQEKSSKTQEKSHIEMIREMNRAAQIRCRNKKKKLYHKMTSELEILRKENAQLKNENAKLRKQNTEYFKIITDLGGSDKISIAHTLYDSNDGDVVGNRLKKLPILAPATKITTLKNSLVLPKPVIYNLVPINVMDNKFTTSVPTISPEVSKRKTVPEILKQT